MKKFTHILLVLTIISLIFSSSVMPAFAVGTAETNAKISDNNGGILAVSFRGDTAVYPKNSLEAIESAENQGADMVSVSVGKTKDGVLVLAEKGDFSAVCKTDETEIGNLTFDEVQELEMLGNDGAVTNCKIVSLEKVLQRKNAKAVLILDNAWENRDEVLALCKKLGATDKVLLRVKTSAKKINEWKNGEEKLGVIGVYGGNIVFNAISHLNKLSENGEKLVQYQSKNYFNVMYDKFTAKRFSNGDNARALAPMYSKDLCGQREDNVSGWDEIVKRGFSVIETNDIGGLSDYIQSTKEESEKLIALFEKAKKVDTSVYTSVSVKNLDSAIKLAEACLESKNTSLGEIQSAFSSLAESLNNLTKGTQSDTQRGSLNITAGKILAVIVFGSLLVLGEIYLIKMRKK